MSGPRVRATRQRPVQRTLDRSFPERRVLFYPKCVNSGVGAALLMLLLTGPLAAQDVEPRRWTHLPVGMNILGLGAIYTDGDIAFDPVLEIQDGTVEIKTVVVSYVRAFGLFGQSARFDVRLPYQDARWEGVLSGEPASTERRGLDDPRVRLSVNFIGAPALKGKAYQAYRAAHPVNTVVGAALAVRLPLGEYKKDKILNLGENRFVFRPQLGFVHTRGHWSYELTGSVFLYTDNDDFVENNKREQDPLLAAQTHLTYVSPQHWWVSVGAARAWGGETKINGENKDDERRDLLYGISAGLPMGSRATVKLAYVANRSSEDVGKDTDNVALGYSIRF